MLKKLTPLARFKKVLAKYMVIDDMSYIDIVCGVLMANKLDSKPVWLYLVGVPSSGKTEILQAFQGDGVVQISTLTKHSLVSAYVAPREEGVKGRPKVDHSLLPQLDGKTMIIKDFTAILSAQYETLHEIVGQLRDCYDGSHTRKTGMDEKPITYRAKFGIIAAVTPIIDKHKGLLAELGERFLTCRMPDISKDEDYRRCWKATEYNRSTVQQEAEIKAAAAEILATPLIKVTIGDSQRAKILELAQYATRARCEVSRDKYTREPEMPSPEATVRLHKQLCNLAVGIAIVHGKSYIDAEIQRLVHKVALDSLTLKRLKTLRILYDAWPRSVPTKDVVAKIGFTDSIIRQWLDDLLMLELITMRTENGNKMWQIKEAALLTRVWK
jgi:hypothetical protein